MPFPDELVMSHVEVVDYRPAWELEAGAMADRLRSLVPAALAVEHIGSTSIAGMASKDCLDMMIVVDDLDASGAAAALTDDGFRERPEPWNRQEPADGSLRPKLVFAPAPGGRSTSTCGLPTHRRPATRCCSATTSARTRSDPPSGGR